MAVKATKDYAAEIQGLQRKLDDARNQVIENDRVAAALSARAESAEAELARVRSDSENLKSGLYETISSQKSGIESLNSKVTSLESEVARVSDDNAKLQESEAAAIALANKYENEIAELRKQLKELQVKLYEFRLAVEKVL